MCKSFWHAHLRHPSIADFVAKALDCPELAKDVVSGGIFLRSGQRIFQQILEEAQLVLPIWCGVTKEAVYEYSPSLLNVKGVDWGALGEDEVCRQIYLAVSTTA